MKGLHTIINQIIIVFSSAMLLLLQLSPQQAVLPITILIAIGGILYYFEDLRFSFVTYCIYCVLCVVNPTYIFGLPVLLYPVLFTTYMPFTAFAYILYLYNMEEFGKERLLILFCVSVISIFLRYQNLSYQKISKQYIQQRDDLTEQSLTLKNKISDLSYDQDLQIKMATLDERNRIAREIHDNVGHLLTRSIIQLGALLAISKDPGMKENLGTIKTTLDEAMNEIRSSVHNLHEDSIDLYEQLNKFIEQFQFCEVKFSYEVEVNLDLKVKYSLISIVKEALSNVMKHSDATIVNISMFEHPEFIQLIIQDNGHCKEEVTVLLNGGLGLESIRQRALQLGGRVKFDCKKGFKIFVTFPHKKGI